MVWATNTIIHSNTLLPFFCFFQLLILCFSFRELIIFLLFCPLFTQVAFLHFPPVSILHPLCGGELMVRPDPPCSPALTPFHGRDVTAPSSLPHLLRPFLRVTVRWKGVSLTWEGRTYSYNKNAWQPRCAGCWHPDKGAQFPPLSGGASAHGNGTQAGITRGQPPHSSSHPHPPHRPPLWLWHLNSQGQCQKNRAAGQWCLGYPSTSGSELHLLSWCTLHFDLLLPQLCWVQ